MGNNREMLDSVICKTGSKIAGMILESKKIKASQLQKALGVLCNDGVYAYYVYVKSEKPLFDILIKELNELMQYTDIKLKQKQPDDQGQGSGQFHGIRAEKPRDDVYDYEAYFINLSKNLNDLLFFREILEETLVYARYHLKAKEAEYETGEQNGES